MARGKSKGLSLSLRLWRGGSGGGGGNGGNGGGGASDPRLDASLFVVVGGLEKSFARNNLELTCRLASDGTFSLFSWKRKELSPVRLGRARALRFSPKSYPKQEQEKRRRRRSGSWGGKNWSFPSRRASFSRRFCGIGPRNTGRREIPFMPVSHLPPNQRSLPPVERFLITPRVHSIAAQVHFRSRLTGAHFLPVAINSAPVPNGENSSRVKFESAHGVALRECYRR